MTTLKSKDVKIRKPRRCFSCLRLFPEKTTMNYWAGIFEGDFSSVYSCTTCKEIMDLATREESQDGFPEGYVRESLEKDQTPEQYLESKKSSTQPTP